LITIIPTREVLKAVTDSNITSRDADVRRESFDKSNELMSLGNVKILIEGVLFQSVKDRLNDDQKEFFESVYKIDNSVKNLKYNFSKAICWIAKNVESKS